MENPTRVVTGKVRFSFCNVFTPVAVNAGETPKYSVCLLIPKTDTKTVDLIKKAIEAAKSENKAKLADKMGRVPSNLKTPLRDGDEERPDAPEFAGMYFINANTHNQPGIVDRDRNPILAKEDFYPGCYGRASINFFAYNVDRSKGIAAGLNNLQKLADGPHLSGGPSAEEDFGGENDWNGDEEDSLM